MSRFLEFLRLAATNLAHRRTRSYLTMVGIFIGIAAVVSLIALGQGLKDAVADQFASIGTDKIMITPAAVGFGPPGTGAVANLTDKDLKIIKSVSGVKTVAGRLIRGVRIESHGEVIYSFAASLPTDDTRKMVLEAVNTDPTSGRMVEPGDHFRATVGADFGEKEKVFAKALQVGDTITVNGHDIEVVGILERTGRQPQGDDYIIMNEEPLREVLSIGDVHDAIVAQVSPGVDVEKTVDGITRALRKSRDVEEGKEDFNVQSTTSFLESLNSVLNIVQSVLVGIAAISLLVGGIGIMNTMYTSVLERTKEIGIMKAIGATNGDIRLIFLIESGLLGMAGGAIGVLLGMGMAKLVEIAAFSAFGKSLIQASFPWYLIVGALAFSFIVGALSGVWPAMQAASLKPVDALRYE